MSSLYAQSELKDLIEKVEKGDRLDFEAGLRLMNSQDILALGYMANLVRERKNGNSTYFIVTQPLNYADAVTKPEITCATMFYGHGESAQERIGYLLQLRELQDKTGGFLSFMPLAYFPEGTTLEEMMESGNSTGFEDLKMLAVARILLDNFDHIKAFWIVLGAKLTQVALSFGVDVLESHFMTKRVLVRLIEKAGREAVEQELLHTDHESV